MPPATFLSKYNETRIVLEPKLPVMDATGVTRFTDGRTVEFRHGRYTAKSAEEAELIRGSYMFGTEVWELGREPGSQQPPTEEMLERITDASVRRNLGKLRELKALEVDGDGELGGHNRPEVLAAVDRALAILTEGKEGKLGPGRPHPVQPED